MVFTDILETEQLGALLKLLQAEDQDLATTAKTFNAEFEKDKAAAVNTLRMLQGNEEILAAVLPSATETMLGFFLLSCMFDQEAAKVAFYEQLQRLEAMLRNDAKKIERMKMRASGKDAARSTGKDVAENDAMRCRLAIKVLALECLAEKVDLSTTPRKRFTMEQTDIDSQLDRWKNETNNIKDKLQELELLTDKERRTTTYGGCAAVGAKGCTPIVTTAEQLGYCLSGAVTPVMVRPPPPAILPQVGELRRTVVTSVTDSLFFDASPHVPEFAQTRELLKQAVAAALPPSDQQILIQNVQVPGLLSSVGLTSHSFCAICTKNPSIAVALVEHYPEPASLIHYLFLPSNGISRETLTMVLVGCKKHLQLPHLTRFINMTVGEVVGTGDAVDEAVKRFAVALHEIVKNGDNSEMQLVNVNKELVAQFFLKHPKVPEVASLWGEMLTPD